MGKGGGGVECARARFRVLSPRSFQVLGPALSRHLDQASLVSERGIKMYEGREKKEWWGKKKYVK